MGGRFLWLVVILKSLLALESLPGRFYLALSLLRLYLNVSLHMVSSQEPRLQN